MSKVNRTFFKTPKKNEHKYFSTLPTFKNLNENT
jgi:hypothetical protein